MDAQLYAEAIQYELLTRSIYQSMLHRGGVENVRVEHNSCLKGRSGVQHQIDVMWKFKQAGINHAVLIECKNYSSPLTLEKVRNFFAVLHDIGNCVGMMITKAGYQSGAADFAKYYGISLKLLRKPNKEDWTGRIKCIHFEVAAKIPVSTPMKPIRVRLWISPSSVDQERRLRALTESGKLLLDARPELRFCNNNGEEYGDELRWILPRVLKVLDKEDGGPYEERIKLDNAYIWVNCGLLEQELVEVAGLTVTYYVETVDRTEKIINGEEIVEAILKDHFTDDLEYTKFPDP
jgi:hypothetical protein